MTLKRVFIEHDAHKEEEYEDTFYDEDFVRLNQKNEYLEYVFFDLLAEHYYIQNGYNFHH